jgi:hypothetical protein
MLTGNAIVKASMFTSLKNFFLFVLKVICVIITSGICKDNDIYVCGGYAYEVSICKEISLTFIYSVIHKLFFKILLSLNKLFLPLYENVFNTFLFQI